MENKPDTTTDENEYITVTIAYGKHEPFERLQSTRSWKNVPDQNKVWERTKDMIDNLYKQVRG